MEAEQRRLIGALVKEADLTERETECLVLMLAGMQDYKQIARRLQVKPSSAAVLRSSVRKKLLGAYQALQAAEQRQAEETRDAASLEGKREWFGYLLSAMRAPANVAPRTPRFQVLGKDRSGITLATTVKANAGAAGACDVEDLLGVEVESAWEQRVTRKREAE